MNEIAPKEARRDLKEALLAPELQAVFSALVPRHMTPERMLRLSISCITRTPKLLEVPQVQVLGALVQCAGIGLEPNSPLQHIHLIPFKNNRRNRMELQTIIGYRGFVELGRRSGKQTWVHGDVVRPGDEFSYAYGNDAHLRHKPGRGSAARQDPTDAYCFVQLTDGFAFTVLPEWEILRHREHSFAWRQDGAKSPWGQHPDRMWRKTAIRALYSGGEVPLDTEIAMAVATDDQRMDYRAMGELALKGGKAAIEHLKEGMDTFVADEEAEPEREERVVEMRSQVRSGPPTPRQEAAQPPTSDDDGQVDQGEPAAPDEPQSGGTGKYEWKGRRFGRLGHVIQGEIAATIEADGWRATRLNMNRELAEHPEIKPLLTADSGTEGDVMPRPIGEDEPEHDPETGEVVEEPTERRIYDFNTGTGSIRKLTADALLAELEGRIDAAPADKPPLFLIRANLETLAAIEAAHADLSGRVRSIRQVLEPEEG